MCRFRNIILQQKIPHVKTFFRPLRFYPFFVRIHHGTVSACIVRTNAQIKTDSFCRRKKLPTKFRQNAADIACCI